MLIESYELEIAVSTHSDEHFTYEAIAHLGVDIGPVLPYLNATLARGIYLPGKPALSWRYEKHNIGFWPHRIAVDHLENREHVTQMIERLVGMVNQTWETRDQIEPDVTTHKRLQPLELYQLLPRSNCKACGEVTCYNFALKLTAAQVQLADCAPLYDDPALAVQREKLESLVATRWPAI